MTGYGDEWIENCQYSFLLVSIFASLSFVVLGNISSNLLLRFSTNYRTLPDLTQRKILVFVLNIIVRAPLAIATIVLLIQFWSFKNGLDINTCAGIRLYQVFSVEFSTLMIYELMKMPEFGWDMWVHHALVMLVVVSITDTIPYASKDSFRNDPYFLEIISWITLGGALVFIGFIPWVYNLLLTFDNNTIASLKRMKTDVLHQIKFSQQTSIQLLIDMDNFDNIQSMVNINVGRHKKVANINNKENDIDMDAYVEDNGDRHGKNINNEAVKEIFDEMDESNITLENLQLNYQSALLKHKIIRFRMITMTLTYCIFFVGIPVPLFFIRMMNNDYKTIETIVILIVLLTIDVTIETYFVYVLIVMYRKQSKKCTKYRLAIDAYNKKQGEVEIIFT